MPQETELSLNELSPKDVFAKRLELEDWNVEHKVSKDRLITMFDEALVNVASTDIDADKAEPLT